MIPHSLAANIGEQLHHSVGVLLVFVVVFFDVHLQCKML